MSKRTPNEHVLVLPVHHQLEGIDTVEVVDTHTHVHSTFQAYIEKYPERTHATIRDYVQATLRSQSAQQVAAVVDVYCEGSDMVHFPDTVAALSDLDGLSYHFVAGAHPHEAKNYTDELERQFLDAHRHPRCVGWGEIGLDYHYDNSPRDIQQEVLRRQLRTAIKSDPRKAITIHTREADEDILRILTEELPREQRLHIHCFTDSPSLAASLLSHFPHLYIGITGVITYSSNLNTAQVVRDLGAACSPSSPAGLRILLESDAPYMPPGNMQAKQLGMTSKQRFPFAHSGVLPWTAEFVAGVLNEVKGEGDERWTTADVLRQARENARACYGV